MVRAAEHLKARPRKGSSVLMTKLKGVLPRLKPEWIIGGRRNRASYV